MANKYDLEIYNCYVHLIRSIGANSLLGFLLAEMLYTFSEDEWSNNLLRFFYTFKLLSQEKSEADDVRFQKISQVLGINKDGEPVEVKKSYSPIYERINDNIPSTTNHIESFHSHLNEIVKHGRLSLQLRLAYILKFIKDRTLRTNASAHENLKSYFKDLRKKAKNIISKNKNLKNNFSYLTCDCNRQFYYSNLFFTHVPCIHTILNDYIDEKLYVEQMTGNEDNDDKSPVKVSRELEDTNQDILTKIITHTENQLSSVIKEFDLNYTVFTTKVMFELKSDEHYKELSNSNPDEFWALFQVRLWHEILDGRKNIKV